MFVVLLRFSDNKAAAGQPMSHQERIERGLDDGAFLLVGSVQPGLGGAVLAHSTSPEELRSASTRTRSSPQDVVTAEIIETAPGMADERLSFLL
ncbi:hypothetical protein GCM10010129_58450 [Streptomyces fumigatiscleroticus]|nr:hypothetical protein GCM10010129_58450 [Streptomyces fumigatiscleroticus]